MSGVPTSGHTSLKFQPDGPLLALQTAIYGSNGTAVWPSGSPHEPKGEVTVVPPHSPAPHPAVDARGYPA